MQFSPISIAWQRRSFYCFWFAAMLLQAHFTELIPDEAYYWTYSQRLAWGYFDHPPLTAVLIRAGYALFHNEVGVRLLFICSSTLFIYLLELIVRPRQLLLFYGAVVSIAIFHFMGFMAVPDNPLLLFAAAFFFLYDRYLKKESALRVIMLAIVIASLLLSKYHGVLVIIFTVASNPSLLRRQSVWLIGLLSLMLFTPHLYWEYRNGFPTVTYHLFQRSHECYNAGFTAGYLLALIFVFGPIVGTVLLFAAFRRRPEGTFDRALKSNLTGILLFFGVMSFRGRVEMNWVSVTVIPAFVLGYQQVSGTHAYHRFAKYAIPVSAIVILLARVFIVHNILPVKWLQDTGYPYYKKWAFQIKDAAGDRPVAFTNSYQDAAEYAFYTHCPSFSLNNIRGRQNQYNLWPEESNAQGRDVLLVPNYDAAGLEPLATVRGTLRKLIIRDFRSTSDVIVHFAGSQLTASPGQLLHVDFYLSRRQGCNVDVEANRDFPVFISYCFCNGKQLQEDHVTDFRVINSMFDGTPQTISIIAPQKKGKYRLSLSLKSGQLPPSINSRGLLIEVK